MCEPVTLTAAALAAAGTGMQIAGQQRAVNAQKDVAAAERIRQQGFQQQQSAAVSQATDRAAAPRVEQDLATAAATREADLRAASPQQVGYLPGQSSGPQVVRDEVDRQRSVASAFTNQQAGARARLGSWQDAMFGLNRDLGRYGQTIATQGGFARGSDRVVPIEMQAAQLRGQGLRTAGDLFQAGAQMLPMGAGLFKSGGPLSGMFAAQGGAKAPSMASTGRIAGPI